MGLIWTILIGLVAGLIARMISSAPKEPSGFIMTALLGVVGAVVATYLGQAIGWYGPNQGAGLIGAVVGALIVLALWNWLFAGRSTSNTLDDRRL
jgi:uncharacterized membrane protein YeaQ/YmgE (transglycosylase-associated protein family)